MHNADSFNYSYLSGGRGGQGNNLMRLRVDDDGALIIIINIIIINDTDERVCTKYLCVNGNL